MVLEVSSAVRDTVSGTNDPIESRNPSLSERKRTKSTAHFLGNAMGVRGLVWADARVSSDFGVIIRKQVMQKTKNQITYAIYARRSSEAEDRQVASIPAQIEELQKIATQEGLTIVEIFSESQSAKAPGRPVFAQMLEALYKGKIGGIICWKLDRLARNPIDGGQISWMLQQGAIKHIQTYGRSYYPSDNVLMMAVELGMANQFIRDLSTNVKRGLRKKYEEGYTPGIAKVGFMNDYGKKGERRILPDPERFELVKEMLHKYLSGNYSVRELHRYADEVLGLRTIQRKKEGGKPVKLSQLYRLLKDPFYAGFFYGIDENGDRKEYQVHPSIPRMITREQFWKAQTMLGRQGIPRPSVHKNIFAYAGLVLCGDCGCAITSDPKLQVICSKCKHKFAYRNKEDCPKCGLKISKMKNATFLHYVYLHCTRGKDKNCPGRLSIHEEDMDVFLANHIRENLEISPALSEWCIQNLHELEKNDTALKEDVRHARKQELEKKEKEYEGLVMMRAKGLIEEDAFVRLGTSLKADIETVKARMAEDPVQDTEAATRPFSLVVGLSDVFLGDDVAAKRSALAEMQSNLTLTRKIPSITVGKPFAILASGLATAKAINPAFEPRNSEADNDETEVFASVRPTLLRG